MYVVGGVPLTKIAHVGCDFDSFWNIPDLFSVTGSHTTSAITSEDNHFSSLQNTLLAITSEHRASWEWTSAAFWEVPQSKAMYVRTKTNAIYCLLWGGGSQPAI